MNAISRNYFCKLKINEKVIQSMHVAKLYNMQNYPITNIEYSFDGRYMMSSNVNGIQVFCVENGTTRRRFSLNTFDIGHISYGDVNSKVFLSSNHDNKVHFLDLHFGKFVCYYEGHQEKIVSLSTLPNEEQFLTSSLDKTVKLWDIRSKLATHMVTLQYPAVCDFDPEGLVFAAAINADHLNLYDVRFTNGKPFAAYIYEKRKNCIWHRMRFSPDGRALLVSSNDTIVHFIDAYDGNVLHKFTGFRNDYSIPLNATITPDAQFVFCGSTDGKIHVFDSFTGHVVCVLHGKHNAAIQCTNFNPKFLFLSTACKLINFWIPRVTEEDDEPEEIERNKQKENCDKLSILEEPISFHLPILCKAPQIPKAELLKDL